MSIFDKVRVPLAFKGKNRFPLSSTTVTSSDWFTLRPVFSRELPPNSSISLKQSYYCRLSSLQKPMFGTGRVVNRAFFVPYNSIMEGFVDFIDDTNSTFIGAGTRLTHVPYAYSSDVVQAMDQANCFTTGTQLDYDVAKKNVSSYSYLKFNFKGRQIYSMFTGLGISLSFYGYHSNDNAAYDQSFSLMKVLAFCKIQADWYFNNNFYERSNQVLAAISAIAREPLSPGSPTLVQRLRDLFNYVYYSVVDNDYFSTATATPVTPTGSSSVVIPDASYDGTPSGSDASQSVVYSPQSASGSSPSSPFIAGRASDSGLSNQPGVFTQFVVNGLAALTSYMQRNNIVGHKAVDRMLARFGVKLDNDLIGRSYYLGSNSAELSIDEIMSNADTEGASLGAYAGRGQTGYRDAKFEFDNDSKCFGVFIILSTIIPDVHYGQGITRDNLHINRLDFLTPEFDSLGPQAIGRCELYYDAKTPSQFEDLEAFEPSKSFGFQHTYAEYCKSDDILSGDFRRINTLDIRAFHMFRMFSEHGVEGSLNIRNYKTISEQFVHANPSEFNKIFNYTDTDYDHFYLVHKFKFNVVQPKVPLVDTYEFHGDNEGRSVKVDLNGTKLQ